MNETKNRETVVLVIQNPDADIIGDFEKNNKLRDLTDNEEAIRS